MVLLIGKAMQKWPIQCVLRTILILNVLIAIVFQNLLAFIYT